MQTDQITTALTEAMPIAIGKLDLEKDCKRVGLIIVDEVNGFATVGAGNLAPPVPNEQVSTMVSETDRLAKQFTEQGWPILAFLDTHVPGKPEPPYPPHCEAGTGEEELVPELKWLETDSNTTLVRKDCINGFIGAIAKTGENAVVEWVKAHQLTDILVVGICTDICVMDFVLTSLSARNHDMMPGLENIHVYDKGCSTFNLPLEVAREAGLPDQAAHPQDVTHYMGLYFMASRGANLVGSVA
ncbi:isochorismatase family protein [Sneathiella limimaris]|uniref:isochorismatase family protein n=1 Tax=Sneathiella limimaris TaxID=1964213 RepID=UPI00146BFE51|nr:isochorismatase family protein [Sneathiella limimaris]